MADNAVKRLTIAKVGDTELVSTYCDNPEQLGKFAHSLALNNAYQVYKEAIGDPPADDVEMQQCRNARDRIVHDFELISQNDRDRYLSVIANRLKVAGLID